MKRSALWRQIDRLSNTDIAGLAVTAFWVALLAGYAVRDLLDGVL